ncbi:MAG: hypothetical protein AAF198_04935 [Pseudomonadota bacterium]
MNVTKIKSDENGAVTVDWVVITAAIVIVGTIVYAIIEPGMENVASSISTALTSQTAPLLQ